MVLVFVFSINRITTHLNNFIICFYHLILENSIHIQHPLHFCISIDSEGSFVISFIANCGNQFFISCSTLFSKLNECFIWFHFILMYFLIHIYHLPYWLRLLYIHIQWTFLTNIKEPFLKYSFHFHLILILYYFC